MTVRIRPFVAADARVMAAIFHAAVHTVGRQHYSAAQCAAWSPAPVDPARLVARAEDGRTMLIAADADDNAIAFADVEEDGHIDLFYCHPDHAGTGVAAALYDAIELHARASGIARLYVEASEPARRFFTRRGFVTERRRDFTRNGVAIHNFAMTKAL